MRVLRYSIGIGPTLVRYQKPGSPTTFQLCLIPFLAYVQIAGMNPHEDVDEKDPEIFPNKPLFARIITILAGPLANYLTASLIVFGIALYGWPQQVPVSPMTVAKVSKDSPADKAGLKEGDVILKANGKTVRNVEELIAVTSPRAEQATDYVIRRDNRPLMHISMTPKRVDERGIIGVTAQSKRIYQAMSLSDAGKAAFTLPANLTMAQIYGIADLIRNRSTEGLTGPVGMGKIVAEQAQKGVVEYLSMLMLLSVALGFFNLLPFPALDGGRLTFLVYEMITRRRPNERFEALVHMMGLVFLIGVLILVTFRDVMG